MKILSVASICFLLGVCACNAPVQKQTDDHKASEHLLVKDFHTQSNADSISYNHLSLDLNVDMDSKRLTGYATWQIENRSKAKTAILDNNGLQIDSIWVDGTAAEWMLGAYDSILGAPVIIPVLPESKVIRIRYATAANARALQWLTPSQTLGKKKAFLYTQSESIQARSWVPCPDGPGIRFTYDATIHTPHDLMAVMSADGNAHTMNDSGVYRFSMPNAIPAYLLALAVGDLRFKTIDERTGVYAEPEMIGKAFAEFQNVGKMVHVAEGLYGPYQWGRYDILVLPPGFPIGGMENPKLTFSTPTIIAGDQSLVNLIAHELAHSWSGNYVTNATWDDIWMNEGFTVYFERRISEAMSNPEYAAMLWELGFQDLEVAVADFGADSRQTWLKQDLKGADSDNGLSDIPYEKGALFLRLLELEFGRSKWDAFLNQYFSTHAFKTITTEQFLAFLNQKLLKNDSSLYEKLQIDAWVYEPGIPNNAPRAKAQRFVQVDEARAIFLQQGNASALSTKDWTTHEWLHFLRKLPKPLDLNRMKQLDEVFAFTNSTNSEIADLWFVMSVAAKYTPAYKKMDAFLELTGRQKFLVPLYTEMIHSGQKAMAQSIYQKYRQNYHPLAQSNLDKLIYRK